MNPTARLSADRQFTRHGRTKMRRLIVELRDQRTATRRLMKAAADREQAKMRRDRPTGFVMLRLGDVAPAPPGRV